MRLPEGNLRSRRRWLTLTQLSGWAFCGAWLAVGCGSSHAGVPSGVARNGAGGATTRFDGGGFGPSVGGAGAEGGGFGGSADLDAGCHRDLSLTAVTLGQPPPFDVVIVADNSDSLSWSQSDLSSGLASLLGSVQGRSVRVFLLTPTQYGASSSAAQEPISGQDVVDWKNAATLQPYAHAMTMYSQACTDPSKTTIPCPSATGQVPFHVHGTWQFEMPPPIAVITPDLSPAEFAAQQKAVSDAVLTLGGGGSPHEQPLCTLSRYVSQARALLPPNVVFVVLSDEDDDSTPTDCLASYDAELDAMTSNSATTPCTSGCDAYRYTGLADTGWQRLSFDCAAFDDTGKQIAGSDKQTWLNLANLSTCDGFAGGPCTADERAQAAPICPSGLAVVTCDRTCTSTQSSCSVDLPDSSIDACTRPFTVAGTTYADLGDYCVKAQGLAGSLRDCVGGGVDYQSSVQLSGTYSPVPLMQGSTTADLVQFFQAQAQASFGQDRYRVEAIVLDPSFSCTLGPGQSYATNLIALAGSSNAFPLCEAYAGALGGVVDFAQALVQTQFTVPLAADESVTAVDVIGQDGGDRVLQNSDFTYDRASQTLTIQRDALGAKDATLRVEITSECRIIPQ